GGASEPTPAQKEESGVLTAEWLEYEIRSPGSPPRTVRRDVFDLLGPAARSSGAAAPELAETQRLERGLALLRTSELLVLGSSLSAQYVESLAIASLLSNRDALLGMLRAGASGQSQGLMDWV